MKVTLAAGSLLAAVMTLLSANIAFADYTEILGATPTLRNPLIPGAQFAQPMQPAAPGQPPPIGDGPNPLPVTPGDLGGPTPPPSGVADPTHGNIFPTRDGGGPKPPWEYVPDAGRHYTKAGRQQGVFDNGAQLMGTGTINNGGARPGATDSGPGGKENGTSVVNNGGARNGAQGLTNNGGDRNGAAGITNNGGARSNSQDVANNGGALQNSQDIVNNGGPRPGAQEVGDRLFTHQNQPNRYNFQGPLPTVRTFSRYLVILGVVSATVFVSLAAMAMVLGSPYGGSRVIGAAGGLLLLLGGYTIWKIVQMDTFHANSIGWESHYRNGQPQPLNPARPGVPKNNGNNGIPGGGNPNGGNGPFLPPQNPLNGAGPNAGGNGGPFNNPNGGKFPQNGGGFPQNGGGFPQNSGGFPQNGGGFPQNGGGGAFPGGVFPPIGNNGPVPNPPTVLPNGGFPGAPTVFPDPNQGNPANNQNSGGGFFNFFNLIPQILNNNANNSRLGN